MDWRLGRCENKLVGTDLMLVFCSDLEKGHCLDRATHGERNKNKIILSKRRRRTMHPFFIIIIAAICISRRFFQSFE